MLLVTRLGSLGFLKGSSSDIFNLSMYHCTSDVVERDPRNTKDAGIFQGTSYLEDHPMTFKWLVTMVIVSPLYGVIPLINGLFMAYK